MDTNFILELINTMGFPIAMVAYFIWFTNKTLAENTRTITTLINSMQDTIDNNTRALIKFLDLSDQTDLLNRKEE